MDLYGDIEGVEIGKTSRTFAAVPSSTGTGTAAKGNVPAAATATVTPFPNNKSMTISSKNVEAEVKKASAGFSMAFKPRQTAVSAPKLAAVKHVAHTLTNNTSVPCVTHVSAPIKASAIEKVQPELGSFEVDDPYDPAQPNDYLMWCDERQELKRLKLVEANNERILQERYRDRVRLEQERAHAIQTGDVQRLEATLGGRGSGRGLSNLPSWMTETSQ